MAQPNELDRHKYLDAKDGKCTCVFVIPVCDAKEDHERRMKEEEKTT